MGCVLLLAAQLHQIISGAVDVLDGSYERAVDKPKSVRCVSRKQVAVVM